MPSLSQKFAAVQKLGWGWALWRAGYELRKKSGLLKRRLPTPRWDEIHLADLLCDGVPANPSEYQRLRTTSPAKFFFSAGQLPDRRLLESIIPGESRGAAIRTADDYCRGRFLYYSRHIFDLGIPPDWLRNPFNNFRHENRSHWCDLSAFSAEAGDIKDVWEPSRFACAYGLARVYAVTGDQKYPEAFWKLFESWCEQNPPNRGPNWRCGQETAFRVMAWCFALHAFWDSPATSPERISAMVCALAFSASRIEPNIDYAVSQKNNHAISEALGLFTVGTLFPELRDAWKWEGDGRSILEREILRQVYEDGSYVQQSMNYHRVMLHDCLWAARLAELNGRPLADEVLDRIDKAAGFLYQMLDTPSGHVSNYGPNDGALVLPLSACDYRDYRPTVQAANYLKSRRRILSQGAWDEALLWLFGEEAVQSPVQTTTQASSAFDIGGYYTIRSNDSWAMMRCHSYLDRPGHVDMLHVDLWHKGVNILRDSGTYRYFAPQEPGIEKFFKDIAAHNTIQIGKSGPLELVSRFIWLPWPRGECMSNDAGRIVGQSLAYARRPWQVRHRRTVESNSAGTTWTISDQLEGRGRDQVTMRWQLAPGECRLDAASRSMTIEVEGIHSVITLDLPQAMQLDIVEGIATKSRIGGWASEYYADKRPAPVLEATGFISLPVTLTTTVSLSIQNPKSRV